MHRTIALLVSLSFAAACGGSDDDKPNQQPDSMHSDSDTAAGKGGPTAGSKSNQNTAGSAGSMDKPSDKPKSCDEDNGGCGDPKYRECKQSDADSVDCSDIDACAEDNGGCGDAKFNSCENNSGKAPTCNSIDQCAKDNGGCGDAKSQMCKNNPGKAPTCSAVDACSKDNGGCGDAASNTCTAKDGKASCTKRVRAVAAGRDHTCAIAGAGELYCWGDDMFGQLGSGADMNMVSSEAKTHPTRVGKENNWTMVAAGGNTSCGIRAPGELYCWGDNEFGHLGAGVMEDYRTAPTRVGTDNDWESIAVGVSHACGTRKGGSMYCWGDNYMGELGDGTTMDRYTPALVGTDSGYTQVATGDATTCAVRVGQLYCWGENAVSQIETVDLVATPMPKPTRVGDADGWSEVSLSLLLACGVRSGELYCWGDNGRGQLGDGTGMESNLPVRAGGDSDWIDVSVSGRTACGTRKGGSLYCWGDNAAGALGIGKSDLVMTPTQVGSDSEWSQLASGNDSMCGVRAGNLYCWGANTRGQLGDGSMEKRDTPTAVTFP